MLPDTTLSARRLWMRLFLRTFVPLLLLALLATLWLWRTEREQALEDLARQADVHLAATQRDLYGTVTAAAVDLMLLANDPELAIRVERPASEWGSHAEHFLSFLSYKPVYDQIRLIDLQGRERLRVNLNRGSPMVMPEEALQDKSNRDYFRDSVGLARGRIYLSGLDLNIEHGQIERPFKPTLRLATPFYDASGVKRGVLVVNLLANQFLEKLGEGGGGRVALLDAAGQWLRGGQEHDNFGAITGEGRLLSQLRPGLWTAISSGTAGYYRDEQGLWSFRRLTPNDPGSQADLLRLRLPFATGPGPQHWWLLNHYDDAALMRAQDAAMRLSLLFGGGALALALIAGVLLASSALKGEARHAREQVFLALLEQAPLGVVVLDQAGEGYFFNRNWVRLTGMNPALAKGQGWWSLLEQADQVRLQAVMAKFLEDGEAPNLEMQLRLGDGSRRWVACMISQGPGPMLRAMACILSFADIQASKDHEAQLANALQLVQGVVTGSGDPILALDRSLRVTLANPALGQAFGAMYRDVPAVGTQLYEWMARSPADQANLMNQFAHALQGRQTQVRLTLGSSRRVFDASFAPLHDDEGNLDGAILFARDVTDMARIQARVARSEELFRAVFSGSLDAVFVLEAVKDETGRIVDFLYVEANQIGLGAVGMQREAFIGKLQSQINPEARELGYFDRYVRAMESGEPFVEEDYLQHAGLKPGWYENRVVPMGWGITLTSRNITARKQAALDLASSEALQRNILDSAPYMIAATDASGKISLLNRAGEQMLGYAADELIGRATPMLFHEPANLSRMAAQLSQELGRTIQPDASLFEAVSLLSTDGVSTREWTYVAKDGRHIPVLLTLTVRRDAEGRALGTMGIAYDISEQKRLEEERDRLHAVVEVLPDMVGMSDLDGQLIYLNQAGRRMRGIAPEASLEGITIRLGWAEWAYQLISRVGLPQALEGKPWSGDTQMILPDGRTLETRQLIVAPRMGGREPNFTATIVHDLTEMRAMEAKMIEDEATLNSVLESVQDAIVVLDENAIVQALNPAVSSVFGYGLHKVMGREIFMLLPQVLAEQYRNSFLQYIETGTHSGKVIGQRVEVDGQRADGSSFPLELTISEVKLGDKRLFTCVMRDISQRKAFEEKLLENIDELQATQDALNAANEQLMDANMELGRMAQQDGLTGVGNRRAFDQRLSAEWARAARSGTALALLMIDVDHFKKYNDGYGHQLGDECLRKVAEILRGAVTRASDFTARYGGEEFAILLPDTDEAGAMEVAVHIRLRLAEAAIPHAFSLTSPHVTVSIGLASVVPLLGVAPDHLVAGADRALYRAKDAGRNRAVGVSSPA